MTTPELRLGRWTGRCADSAAPVENWELHTYLPIGPRAPGGALFPARARSCGVLTTQIAPNYGTVLSKEKKILALVEAWRVGNPCTETESFLPESNWLSHLAKRPELQGHLFSVRDTVSNPEFAIVTETGAVFKYRLGYGTRKTRGLRLVVIERPSEQEPNEHPVVTAYFTGEIVEGRLLCWRPQGTEGGMR